MLGKNGSLGVTVSLVRKQRYSRWTVTRESVWVDIDRSQQTDVTATAELGSEIAGIQSCPQKQTITILACLRLFAEGGLNEDCPGFRTGVFFHQHLFFCFSVVGVVFFSQKGSAGYSVKFKILLDHR